jgi:hypothetical protein
MPSYPCLRVALVVASDNRQFADDLLAWVQGRSDVAIVALDETAPTEKLGALAELVHRLEARAFRSRLAKTAPAPANRPGPDDGGPIDLVIALGLAQPMPGQLARASLGGLQLDLGAAPGFWAIAARNVSTAFAIRRLDSGAVITLGRMETTPYWSTNRANLIVKALAYLKRQVIAIAATRVLPAAVAEVDGPRQDRPGPDAAVAYAARAAMRIGRALALRPLRRYQRWRVRVAPGGWRDLNPALAAEIPNRPGHFLADPFLLHHNGRDLLFVEDFDDTTNLGFLAVYELKDGRAEHLGEVLREPFHLSFPFVFEYEGRVLMVPETGSIGEIRVYEAQDFPLNWKPVATLMKGVHACDTMLFPRDGKWWMLTNIDSAAIISYADELHLFWADHPLSDNWTPHPMNPVRFDPRFARNGGLLRDGDTLFRVAQKQDFLYYGRSITVFEIVTLNETVYEERAVKTLGPDFDARFSGLHHLHSNGRYTVFDVARHEPLR